MGYKIKIDKDTYKCSACNYKRKRSMGMFNEDEHCPCCPSCGELIEDDDDY